MDEATSVKQDLYGASQQGRQVYQRWNDGKHYQRCLTRTAPANCPAVTRIRLCTVAVGRGFRATSRRLRAAVMMHAYEQRSQWYDAKRQIKRRVSMSDLLHEERVKFRGRGRCDCPFCRGSQRGTMSYTSEFFNCFRCSAKGDVFTFVELTRHCSFRSAMEHTARLARVELPSARKLSPEERRRFAREAAERKRREEERATAKKEWIRQESAMRLACRNQIHKCDQLLSKPGPWTEQDWQRARAAQVLRDEFLLPEYLVLSFAPAESLAYVLAGEQERTAMLRAIREAGGVRAEPIEGEKYAHFVEVVT